MIACGDIIELDVCGYRLSCEKENRQNGGHG
jgi:hypothetical protein